MLNRVVKNSKSGFSLMEVMIAVSILGIAILGTSGFLGQVLKSKRKDRLRQTQEIIAASLKNSMRSPSHILYSITRHDVNPTLAKCLLGIKQSNGSSVCPMAMDPKKPISFGLYEVTNSDGTKGKLLSSPEQGQPIYYDINGEFCTNLKDNCIFEAKTYFYVSCDRTKDPSCSNGATQLFFSYQIEQKIPIKSLGAKLPPYPRVPIVTPLNAVQILGPHRFSKCGGDVSKLDEKSGNFSKDYAKGHFANLVGYDNTGNPICKCLYPFVKESEETDPITGMVTPVCRLLTKQELSCDDSNAETAYLRGFKSSDDAKEAICVNQDDAFDCESMLLGDDCPTGSWITTQVATSCIFVCEFVPDMDVHTCEISWEFPHPAGPGQLEDDHVFPDFVCENRDLYCCQPTQFSEKIQE